jgi:hypothetical protein
MGPLPCLEQEAWVIKGLLAPPPWAPGRVWGGDPSHGLSTEFGMLGATFLELQDPKELLFALRGTHRPQTTGNLGDAASSQGRVAVSSLIWGS